MERSVGMLSDISNWEGAPRWHSEAHGVVHAPRGSDLELSVFGQNGGSDLSWMGHLRPDDIYRLSISRCNIGGNQLSHVHWLSGLVELNLAESTGVQPQDFSFLPSMKELRLLDCTYATLIDDTALPYISKSEQLTTLALGGANVSDAGVVNIDILGGLRQLYLNQTIITDEALEQLGTLHLLEKLVVWGTGVRGPGLRHLAGLTSLRELIVPHQVEMIAFSALKEALPHCAITWH